MLTWESPCNGHPVRGSGVLPVGPYTRWAILDVLDEPRLDILARLFPPHFSQLYKPDWGLYRLRVEG
jgi:hypothetical protein